VKILMAVMGLLVASQSYASDYGDKQCKIVLVVAENVITGGSGSFYEAKVAVSKDLLSQQYQGAFVRLQYNGNGPANDGAGPAQPISSEDSGRYVTYLFKLPFGAAYRSDTLRLIPYISNGIDRLFDNNFGEGEVLLERASNWRFNQGSCALN
jgi:hypothetical protein